MRNTDRKEKTKKKNQIIFQIFFFSISITRKRSIKYQFSAQSQATPIAVRRLCKILTFP